jgi:hypothetical protein
MTLVRHIDGLPVVDAKRPLKLKITAGDIAKAADSTKEPDRCAVARACYRELHVKEARIHLGRIYLRTNDHNWVRYKTPPELRTEIIAFDRGGRFQPQEVVIKPVSPKEQKGGHTGGPMPPRAQRKPGKPRRPYHRVEDVRGGPA